MKAFLFVLLLLGFPVQDNGGEQIRLSKIKNIEDAKTYIKRIAPPYVKFEPCGDYFIIASREEADKPKMMYYEGKDAKGGEVKQRNAAFRTELLTVEIDNSLKEPEVLIRPAMPPFTYRMSQKDYETAPCLPKPGNKQ